MDNPQSNAVPARILGFSIAITAAISLGVIAAVFLISNADFAFELKFGVVIGLSVGYLAACVGFYIYQRGKAAALQASSAPKAAGEGAFNEIVEAKLLVLEEANEFFGASLKFSDMFRLVASRIAEIVPYGACVLYVRSENAVDRVLELKYAVGRNSQMFLNSRADLNKGLAVKALLSGRTQFDPQLLFERRIFPPEVVDGFVSAAAVPLASRGEAFGVIVLYGLPDTPIDQASAKLLTAVAERVAPLVANSAAFEQSVSNALTDSLTNLPNERGFFLVLENQLAESLRFRDERPLSVLTMDIGGFDEINRRCGHATGDRLLEFAATTIKKQLRQMDVLTRATGDEFLAVLPTANEKICGEVIGRIKRAFVVTQFEMSPTERINLEINFGHATFWRDGETAEHLLRTARIRKVQDKSAEPNKVIFFPKEFVN